MGSSVDQQDIQIADKDKEDNIESAPPRLCTFGCHSLYSAWTSFCNWLHNILEKMFGAMGESISNHPFATIAVAVLIVGVCSIGFLWLNPENRTSKIFVPQNSKSMQDLNKANKFFQLKLRREQIIMVPKNGQDILDASCLKEALQIHHMVENLTGYADVCSVGSELKARSKEFCIGINPLELFNFSEENFVNITGKLKEALTCPGLLMRNGRPSCLNMPKMFAGITKNKSTNQVLSAQALKMTYFVEEPNSDEETNRVESWEESFIAKLSSMQDDLSSVTIYISAERSLDDAIAASSSSDIRWFSLTFTIMLQFASMMVGKLFRNPLTGHSLLALGGTFSVGLGILVGFSLSMMIQTPFVRIVGVLPFLVTGIGLDDMFIIVDHLDRQQRHLNVPVTVKQVMSGTGVTITMTTLTDLVAFAVSTNSQFLSISYFCTYAALTISCAFLMIVTVFVALLSFDVRRIKANRRNCLPMCHAPEPKEGQPPWDEPRPQVSNRLMQRWGKFLMRSTTKTTVLMISLGLLGAGLYATIHLDQEFDRTLLAKEGSDYKAFLKMDRKYFKLPTEVNIVLSGNVEYKTVFVQNEVIRLSKLASENKYFEKNTITWMGALLKYCRDHNKTCDGESFTASLKDFRNTYEFSYFKGDIKFSQNKTNIDATRIIAYMKSSSSSVFKKDAMLSIRKDMTTKSKLPVYVAAASFIYLEQYAIILSETIRNLVVAALAILIVTAPFLVNFSVSFLVFFGFVSLIFELFGMMWLLGVSLNAISMINLVMAIGFAVDYSAHIAHAFVKAPDSFADKRVVEAVTHVGASVLLGGASTLIGIFMTAFSKSEIFKIFFKMFFSMVLLGLLHGLCFLPVHLSILYKLTSLVYKRSGVHLCYGNVGVVSNTEGANINPGADEVQDLKNATPVEHSGINLSQKVCEYALFPKPTEQLNVSATKDASAEEQSNDVPSARPFCLRTSNSAEICEEEEASLSPNVCGDALSVTSTEQLNDTATKDASAEEQSSDVPSARPFYLTTSNSAESFEEEEASLSPNVCGDALSLISTEQLNDTATKDASAEEQSSDVPSARPFCLTTSNSAEICEEEEASLSPNVCGDALSLISTEQLNDTATRDASAEEQSSDVPSARPFYLTTSNSAESCEEEEASLSPNVCGDALSLISTEQLNDTATKDASAEEQSSDVPSARPFCLTTSNSAEICEEEEASLPPNVCGDALSLISTEQLNDTATKEPEVFEMHEKSISEASAGEQANDVPSAHSFCLTTSNSAEMCEEEETLSNDSNDTKM